MGANEKKICMIAYTHYATDPRVKREAEALAESARVDMISLNTNMRCKSIMNLTFHYIGLSRYRSDSRFGYIINYLIFMIKVFLKLNSLDLTRKYDMIYFHTMPDFIVFTGIIQKLKGKSIILDIHDLSPELYAIKFGKDSNSWLYRILVNLERSCAAFANLVISVHHPHQKRLIMRKIKNPTVIMNIPDDSIFNPSGRRPISAKRFVFHGTVSKRLGIEMFIKAANKMKSDGVSDITLNIIGVGEFSQRLKNLVEKNGLGKIVVFDNKFYPVDELPGIIGDALAGIVPYEDNIVHRYSLSVKMLEYIAMKIPVLTTDLASTRYYFDENHLVFYRSSDVDDLYAKILYMSNNREEIKKKAEAAYAKLYESFDWTSEKQKLKSLVLGR
jgi:glycosyltransferase involved in cell wall biosynthesis